MSRDESEAPSLRDQTQAFLHEFFVKGQELIRELIEENERPIGRLTMWLQPVGADSTTQVMAPRRSEREFQISVRNGWASMAGIMPCRSVLGSP